MECAQCNHDNEREKKQIFVEHIRAENIRKFIEDGVRLLPVKDLRYDFLCSLCYDYMSVSCF